MTLTNRYILNLDLKRRFENYVVTFRTGDNIELLININDDGEHYDISNADKATMFQRTPSGKSLSGQATFDTYDGRRVVKYILEKSYTFEIGFNTMILVIEGGGKEISIQPFSIYIHDDLTSESGSYIELIQDLMQQIEDLTNELVNTIPLEEKGVPNGVATLDNDGKIPENQMPKEFDDLITHITQTVYEHQVHGMRINDKNVLQHVDDNYRWVDTGVVVDESIINHEFLKVDITIKDGVVSLNYYGGPNVVSQKWSIGDKPISYFQNEGNLISGTTFEVDSVGIHTLWYEDDNGNVYTKSFEVNIEDLILPEIEVVVNDGVVEIDTNIDVEVKKWDEGERDIPYFQTNGNVITGNTFNVDKAGTYTVYVKTKGGLETVYVFEVSPSQLKKTEITINVVDGNATVTHTPNYEIQTSKFDTGSRSLSYFISNGTSYINGTFKVTQIGTHTVYHKYTNGMESIKTFNVTQDMLEKDLVAPTLDLTQSNIDGKNVRITATASDGQSGIKSITLPNNNEVLGGNATYDVNQNGTYTFKATDNYGNVTTKSITVTTIDNIAPTLNVNPTPTNPTNGNVTVYVTASDNESGLNLIKWQSGNRDATYFKTNGNVLSGNNFLVTSNNTFTVYAEDNAGNTTIKTVTISNIDKVAPTLNLTSTNYGNSAIITANASDADSGIANIKLPDNTTVNSSNANYTVYGNGTFSFTATDRAGNSTTKSITVSGIIVNSEVSYSHNGSTFKIATSGEVYAQGANNRGQLGIGNTTNSTSNTPRKSIIDGVTKIATASSGTYYLKSSGEIFFSGASSSYNFPLPMGDYTTPTKVQGISNAARIVIDEYGDSLFYQTSNGDWYAMGKNNYGQLGLGYSGSEITTPTRINSFSDEIVDITTEKQFTVFVLADGRVYYTGMVRLPLITRDTTVVNPTQITGFPSSKPKMAVLSRQGSNVLFVLNNTSSQVMGLGHNKNFELGLGYKGEIADSPIAINGFGGATKITSTISGFIILNSSGEVKVTGEAKYVGVTGTFDTFTNYAKTPTSVSFTGTGKDIQSGSFSIFIHTTNGRIYGGGTSIDNYFANNDTDINNRVDRLSNLE